MNIKWDNDDFLLTGTISGKSVAEFDKYCRYNAKSYGNKIDQTFFDEFVTEVKEENKSMFKVGDHVITTRASWVIPAGTKGYVMDIDPVKGIYVGYKNGVDTPNGRLMTRWTDPCDLKVISLEEYDKRMVKKENNTMRFADETIVKISMCPGFNLKGVWGVIKRYYGDGKYGVYSFSKPTTNLGIFDEEYLTAYEEIMHDPERLIQPGSLAISTSTRCIYLCKIISVSFEPNSRPEYDLMDIDGSDVFHHRIYKEDFILVKPIKRNYKDEILTPTPAYFARKFTCPEKVIFSGNRTVVLWSDGDKTIVKANCEAFDREKGLAMAIAKKFLGTNASKSNYYDVFKKWIPEELIEQHAVESEPKEVPVSKPEEEERPWDSSMRHQVSDEIVDKILEGADTEDLKKSIEKSKKILDAEKKGVRPSISGYFPSEPSERGPIQDFVERFKPGYFPAEFIAFCKKHNLGFIVDGKVVNPYEVKWQNVAGFLRRGVIAMRKKVNQNDGHEYMAVDMENMLFQRLPRSTKTILEGDGKNEELAVNKKVSGKTIGTDQFITKESEGGF